MVDGRNRASAGSAVPKCCVATPPTTRAARVHVCSASYHSPTTLVFTVLLASSCGSLWKEAAPTRCKGPTRDLRPQRMWVHTCRQRLHLGV